MGEKSMINRPVKFWGGALRNLYPYAAERLIESCSTSPKAVIEFLESDLDSIVDKERKQAVQTLLTQIKQA
jgi:hypothetical protein